MPGRFNRMLTAAAMLANRAGLITIPWRQGGTLPGSRMLTMGAVSTDDAMRGSALSACVRLISGSVAKLPAPVYRMDGDNRKRDRKHPVDVILNRRPNSWQTPFEFRKMMTAHVALHGNAFALKRFEGARLAALIPLVGTMRVEQEAFDEPPTYLFTPPRQAQRRYAAREIFHLRDLTLDGVVGLSRIQQAAQGIVLTTSAETFGTSYFLNGAEPGVVISVPNKLNVEQRDGLLKSWRETHGGPGRAHGPFVMEGGATIDKTTRTNRESQFLELRGFQVEDICRFYGVPPHMVGRTEKNTSWGTGVEQAALGFLKFSLLDWLVMWETAAQRDLLEDDVFVEHVVEGLLRADFQTRMEGYALAIQNGIYSPNEVRRFENKEPRKDGKGDEYWRPSNMTGADKPVTPKMPAAAVLPGDRPEHAWRTEFRSALRVVGNRKSA